MRLIATFGDYNLALKLHFNSHRALREINVTYTKGHETIPTGILESKSFLESYHWYNP